MSADTFRALCAELVDAVDRLLSQGRSPVNPGQRLILTVHVEDLGAIADRARTLLAQPEPEGPSNRIASIAKAVQECALAWEPDARLVGNVRAEDIADLCSALLARRSTPQPPAAGEVGA